MLTNLFLLLGGIGECVQVGYSLISQESEGNNNILISFCFTFTLILLLTDVPTASLTFYTLNCETGKWFSSTHILSQEEHVFFPIYQKPSHITTIITIK